LDGLQIFIGHGGYLRLPSFPSPRAFGSAPPSREPDGNRCLQDAFDLNVRARNDVHRDQFTDTARRRCAGICCGLDRTDITAHKDGD